ncbi:vWA domain-containing protein [Thalassoglobus sp.]|uniref:vWA domain-containing protein n=1 Tax=Thalassoglobus sp. TaxID=2795869 RepID=UPI003AA989D8
MFTHPWAIFIGIFAAGLPVLIHWLTRPRPVRLPVSTLRFIRGAVQQRRAKYRLRDILVLLLRTAAILLLAFAIARPLMNQKVVAATDESPANIVRVVLLDCSQSMAARSGGIAHFERARPLALDSVKFQNSMKANLLLAAASPSPVFAGPTTNLRALREALQKSTVRPEQLRVQPALNLAGEMLSQSGAGAKIELIIYSDFQRANWTSADFSVLPQECDIQLNTVTSDKDVPNLAILNVSPGGRVQTGQETQFTVEVANHSNTPRHTRVELSLGSVVIPFEGHVPARAKSTLGGRVPTPGSGWQIGEAKIVGQNDALPNDDIRAIATEVHPQPRVSYLTREERNKVASSAYFLERSVEATGVASTLQSSNWVDAADPDVDLLRSSDVVLLVRPGRLSRQTIAVLAAMVQRGVSLLYVASDPLDASNLKDLADALGSTARMPVEFAPLSSDRSGSRRFLTDVDRRHSPFSAFGDELAAALKSLQFEGGLISRPLPDGLKEDIRGTLSDQSAFLTITSTGRGKLAVLNVDLERSNLARTPILVPLIGELISEELASGQQIKQTFSCGEPFTLTLSVGEERIEDLQLIGPDGSEISDPEIRGKLNATPTGIAWEVPKAGPPGVYQVLLEKKTVAAIATSIPAVESDLRMIPGNVFKERLSGGRQLTYQAGSSLTNEEQDTFWVWLAAGSLFCMMGELFTLKIFRT